MQGFELVARALSEQYLQILLWYTSDEAED